MCPPLAAGVLISSKTAQFATATSIEKSQKSATVSTVAFAAKPLSSVFSSSPPPYHLPVRC